MKTEAVRLCDLTARGAKAARVRQRVRSHNTHKGKLAFKVWQDARPRRKKRLIALDCKLTSERRERLAVMRLEREAEALKKNPQRSLAVHRKARRHAVASAPLGSPATLSERSRTIARRAAREAQHAATIARAIARRQQRESAPEKAQ